MHEYSLMEGILEGVVRDLRQRGIQTPGEVKEMSLKIGALEIHSTESFQQAFEMLAKGTLLESCRLKLEILPATLECSSCKYIGPVRTDADAGHHALPVAECPQCGTATPVQGGRGVEPVEVTIEDKSTP